MNEFKDTLRQAFQPIVDTLVDTTLSYYENVYLKLPDTMSEEDKLKVIESTINATAQSMIEDMKSLKAQEAKDGR